MQDLLNDNWVVKGNGISDFKRELTAFDARTIYRVCQLDEIELLSVIPMTEYEIMNKHFDLEEGQDLVFRLNNKNAKELNLKPYLINFENAFLSNDFKSERIKETRKMGLCLFVNKRPESITAWGLLDLAQRTGVCCDKIYDISSNRTRWLAQNLSAQNCTIVVRTDGKNKKVFAVRGKNYKGVPQMSYVPQVLEFLEGLLGESTLEFCISNELTEVMMKFTEKGKEIRDTYPELPTDVEPIVYIENSDTGKYALNVKAGFNIGRHILSARGATKDKHDKGFNLEKVLANAKKTIFKEYKEIPEQLIRLLGIKITDAERAIDEAVRYSEIEKKSGFKKISAVFKEAMKQSLSLGTYTAYDLFNTALDVAENLKISTAKMEIKDIPEITRKQFSECVQKILYCPFECEQESDDEFLYIPSETA
ncbi:MAG: hypothetical protein K6F27_04090 [Ruminococcus sp.]|nr:hypothetical protein [Ruminococcus sp.]